MSMSLKSTCFDLWRNTYERQGIRSEFKPVFIRYIGVEKSTEYNDVLKTLVTKIQGDSEHSIFFDGQIPMTAEFNLLNSVKAELASMDVSHISTQDITLFTDVERNQKFLKALEYVVNLAIMQEHFPNDSVRNNFICKMILYAYLYTFNLKVESNNTCKCIYYGDISRHDIYFLMLLHKMNFDVVYINPAREEYWSELDSDHLSEIHKNKEILPILTLAERIKDANVLEMNESMTLQFERQIEDEMFTNTGVFRPWQFRDGNTIPVFFNSTLIDLEQNWTAPAKVRTGFKVDGKTVYVPNFFHYVEGEYKKIEDYARIVNLCAYSENTLLVRGDGRTMITNIQPEDSKFQLMFCQLGDGTFDIEEIKKLPFYTLSVYNEYTQNLMLNKINETIKDFAFFKDPLDTKEEKIEFAMLVLELDKTVIRLIDNFDFTNDIPKITVFLDNENKLSRDAYFILAYLNKIGFDIAVFSPAGMSEINIHVQDSRYNYNRLDTINYERSLESLKHKDKKGFFSKFFCL